MGRMQWREALVVGCLLLALLGVVSLRVQAQLLEPAYVLEPRQMAELRAELDRASADPTYRRLFNSAKMRELHGRGFWEFLFQQQALEPRYLGHLVSLNSKAEDRPLEAAKIEEGLPQRACSYTSPMAEDWLDLKAEIGKVAFCLDSRNWDNYGARGVVVSWTTGEAGMFFTAERLVADYKLEKGEFSPKLFGRLAPFDRTHEEKESVDLAAKDAERRKDEKAVDYGSLYRKAGRKWTYRQVIVDGKEKTVRHVREEVIIVFDDLAKVLRERLDDRMQPLDGEAAQVIEVSLADPDLCRPAGAWREESKLVDQDGAPLPAKPMDAAGRAWVVEKWVKHEPKGWELWMSKDIPGLVIKLVNGNETITLSDFHENE